MRTTAVVAIASGIALAGCVPKPTVLPDRCVPHRLAAPATVEVWVRRADQSVVRQRIRAEADWWIATPEAIAGCPR